MTYLGLVDDEYDDYEVYEEPQPARPRPVQPAEPDPAMTGVRPFPRDSALEPSGITMPARPAVVRPIAPVHTARVHVVEARTFNDAPEVGDRLKNGQPVIVNVIAADRETAHRLIDFCSGAVYVTDADMKQVAKGVFLLTPANVEVSAEEKRRLQERGLYRT
jgi:cell division inhibitor SepF